MTQKDVCAALFLWLCIAFCVVAQDLESEESSGAPDFFDLDYELDVVEDAFDESESAERTVLVEEESTEPSLIAVTADDAASITVTTEEFPACSNYENAEALYSVQEILWSVGLEDEIDCCEICAAYLECVMWTMDINGQLCTLLTTRELETRFNPDFATGYK